MEEKYSLLRDAYAIIDGIPEEQFDLNTWVKKEGRSLGCGTIACAAGWLAQHPKLKEQGFHLKSNYSNHESFRFFPAYDGMSGFMAISSFFDLTFEDAEQIFGNRILQSIYDPQNGDDLSSKELWKARVRKFLEVNG